MAKITNIIEQAAVVGADIFESATLGAIDFAFNVGGQQSRGFMKLVTAAPGGKEVLTRFLRSRGLDESKVSDIMSRVDKRQWGE